jgi:hypothetical protein
MTIAALNRQIDHLLDQQRIKRHAIPSDTTAGPTKPTGDRDALPPTTSLKRPGNLRRRETCRS